MKLSISGLAAFVCISACFVGCSSSIDDPAPAAGAPGGAAGAAGMTGEEIPAGGEGGMNGLDDAGWGVAGAAGEPAADAGEPDPDAGVEDAPSEPADAAEPDAVAPPDVCEGEADGAYCGKALGVAASSLVTCASGATSATKTCANGCLQTSIGSDVCKSACCLAKPPGSFVRGYNACSAYTSGSAHYGIDYSSALGTKIPAGMDGTVVKIVTGYGNCWGSGSGSIACSNTCMAHYNMIRIKSACGDPKSSAKDFYVEYAHVQKIATGIKVGSVVKKGQVIAYVGQSGCASGPHIHFETMSVAKGATPTVHTCGSVDPKTRYCP
jgi:hypothetical protein